MLHNGCLQLLPGARATLGPKVLDVGVVHNVVLRKVACLVNLGHGLGIIGPVERLGCVRNVEQNRAVRMSQQLISMPRRTSTYSVKSGLQLLKGGHVGSHDGACCEPKNMRHWEILHLRWPVKLLHYPAVGVLLITVMSWTLVSRVFVLKMRRQDSYPHRRRTTLQTICVQSHEVVHLVEPVELLR